MDGEACFHLERAGHPDQEPRPEQQNLVVGCGLLRWKIPPTESKVFLKRLALGKLS